VGSEERRKAREHGQVFVGGFWEDKTMGSEKSQSWEKRLNTAFQKSLAECVGDLCAYWEPTRGSLNKSSIKKTIMKDYKDIEGNVGKGTT